MSKLTTSLVVYNSKKQDLDKLLSLIEQAKYIEKLYVIDNNPSQENKNYFLSSAVGSIVEYIPHNNTGYGSNYNIALRKAMDEGAEYHVILNPDIYFGPEVLPEFLRFMDENKDVGYVLPKVTYPNGWNSSIIILIPI